MSTSRPPEMPDQAPIRAGDPPSPNPILRVAMVVGLLFLFLLGVDGLGDGFKLLGRDTVDAFFRATSNPFFSLIVGILGTTLVQSSSVSTSMIVALVAAPENPLPLANAVPMIMGANIGTTVTNTLASIGHITRQDEFRRAFAVATCHDFFNFLTVLVLLPLELMTGFQQASARWLALFLEGSSGYTYESPLKGALDAAMVPILGLIELVFVEDAGRAIALALVSAGLIFTALFLLVRVMRSVMQSRVERFITGVLGSSAILSMAVGAIATVMVQSSSITTSLLVPLGGAALITLPQAFPITIGANIGTTVTALLAALAVSGPNAAAGIQIALVHLLFNIVGTVLIYPLRPIRNLPLAGARALADVAVRSRALAIGYVLGLFYGLPGLLVLLDRLLK